MKSLLRLFIVAAVLIAAFQPALAQELAAPQSMAQAQVPPVELNEVPPPGEPVEVAPIKPGEIWIPPTETAMPEAVVPEAVVPLEEDHPLYLIGIMLYPVGRLLELVIVKPIHFIFDHPFSEPTEVRMRPNERYPGQTP